MKVNEEMMPLIINANEKIDILDSRILYKPLAVVLSKRIYRVNAWKDAFKLIMYHNYNKFKRFNKDALIEDINCPITKNGSMYIVSDEDDSSTYAKFADNLYIHVYKTVKDNLIELNYLKNKYGCKFELYLLSYIDEIDEDIYKEFQDKCIQDVINKEIIKEKRSRNYISYINNKILSNEEKFYKRIEKEFDKKILIGDILLNDQEESILNTFMKTSLKSLLTNNKIGSTHDKVFAYGLVKYASKYYKQNRFWPYFKEEYGFEIPTSKQVLLNTTFEKIIKKYGKAFIDYETGPRYTQNICMHAFICDNCADQLFDYIFEFWRIDLNRSVENMIDDAGNNIFDILVDEIENDSNIQIQDVMAHTTMAMRVNRRSCRSKFRRILMMIDNSYWNDADYSSSKDRITILFNQWRKKGTSAFVKEQKKDIKNKVTGRGKKMLSSPTLVYDPINKRFRIVLPKEILRFCDETEHPTWTILIESKERSITPTLLEGKAALYSNECFIEIEDNEIFSEIMINLSSEKRNYIKKTIVEENVRFFSNDFRHININDDCVSKDTAYAFVKNGNVIEKIGSRGGYNEHYNDNIDLFYLESVEGDLFILPNGKAVSVGTPIKDGFIGANRVKDVLVSFEDKEFEVYKRIDQLFFKTSKEKMRGTSLHISNLTNTIYDGKINLSGVKEFKLDDMVKDIYGYIVKLSDYIKTEGLYIIELNIPGLDIRQYSICYLYDFEYEFVGAPYIFKESGTISLPSSFQPKNKKDWETAGNNKCLTFSFKESDDKDINEYFIEEKLLIESTISDKSVLFSFEVPILFWKFKEKEMWSYLSPKTIAVRDLPSKIYVKGNLSLSTSTMYINDEMKFESETSTYKDDKGHYYFRTADFIEFFGRDKDYKDLSIQINGLSYTFMSIACRSIVKNQSVVGFFEEKKIIGNFEIVGNSDYYVAISKKEEIIDDYVPLVNGYFEVDCDVEEGAYTVSLFEQESDDSGFDSVSFKLMDIPIYIKDLSNLTDRCLDLIEISYVDQKIEGISFSSDYKIISLKRLDYYNCIFNKIDIMTWKYDSSDEDKMSEFDYYKGALVKNVGSNNGNKLFDVLVMLKRNNLNEAAIYCLDDDEAREICFDTNKKQIVSDETLYSRTQSIKYLKVLYDDEYIIKVKVNDESLKIKDQLPVIDKKKLSKINNRNIENCGFTVRTYNALKRANIDTLSQLAKMSKEELRFVRNISKKQIAEINSVLKKHISSLKEE